MDQLAERAATLSSADAGASGCVCVGVCVFGGCVYCGLVVLTILWFPNSVF